MSALHREHSAAPREKARPDVASSSASPETARARPTFIVSSGRCGSTLLSNMLRLHPALLSVSELLSMAGGAPRLLPPGRISSAQFWCTLSELTPDMVALLRLASVPEILVDINKVPVAQLSSLELTMLPHLSDDPQGLLQELRQHVLSAGERTPAEHLTGMLEWSRQRFSRRAWVERSGGSLEYVDLLTANWPDARIVHLTRDGRDTALSMASHPMFRVHVARILAKDPQLPVETCLRAELAVDRFGAYWSALMIKGQRLLRAHAPEAQLLVRYEQLIADPQKVLAELSAFILNEAAPAAWLEAAAKLVRVVPSRWTQLERDESARLDAACRPGMRCLRDMQ